MSTTALELLEQERDEHLAAAKASTAQADRLETAIAAVRAATGTPRAGGKRKAKKTAGRTKPAGKKGAAAAEPKLGDDLHAKALALYKQGKYVTEIASILGVSGATIYNWKKAENWPPQ